jgi:hypothetical protein
LGSSETQRELIDEIARHQDLDEEEHDCYEEEELDDTQNSLLEKVTTHVTDSSGRCLPAIVKDAEA